MKRVLLVFGTRPEAIKMAPVVKALMAQEGLETRVCISSQHRELLQPALELFDLKPDYDLDIMRPGQSLSGITARILLALEPVLKDCQPNIMLVHGDTTTGFAAALSGFYHDVPVAHVEAGLRTGNIKSPWPEEFNRTTIGQLASLHFAPTKQCRENLLREAVQESRIHVTGNTVIDALIQVRDVVNARDEQRQKLEREFDFLDSSRRLILITGHRRENYGEGFESICTALESLASSCSDSVELVYPVHLNPNVKQVVEARLSGIPNLHLIEPIGYSEFVYLMARCFLILTDSGGIQEEAPAFGKPVLVMRDTTERPEAIDAGTARLVGTDSELIVTETLRLLSDSSHYDAMARAGSPFGDGTAAIQIAAAIADYC
ncbi:MAG: UDP-N-acetylglucosamine 2-epimerase (non-hydrolyzing) [Halieaceae bacterium]